MQEGIRRFSNSVIPNDKSEYHFFVDSEFVNKEFKCRNLKSFKSPIWWDESGTYKKMFDI